MTSHQTAAIPVIRHHKRSVDRVLPPALEIRLARLSIDEGESKNAHIVPAPPSLPLRMGMPDFDRVYNQTDSPNSFSSCSSVNSSNNGLESIIEGGPSSYTNKNRLGKLGSSPDKGITGLHRHRDNHHHRYHHHHHHRSRSMLNPQVPSALFQIDQQHQQHYHQPNISVQYHRRNRSGSLLLDDSRGTNKTSDNGGGSPFQPLLFPQKAPSGSGGGFVCTESPMTRDTTEFGEDLFHWNSLELDNVFADSLTTATTIAKTGIMASSIINHGPHPHRQAGNYKCDGSKNESDISLQEGPSTYHTPSSLHSPSRKGPLSANSSPVSSRPGSPLQKLFENVVRVRDQLLESSQAKAQQGLRIDALENSGDYLDILEIDENRLPRGSPMSIGAMSNDQDRWKSPTLSALASRSSSRGPSPRPLSPPPLSQRSVIVMATSTRHVNTDKGHLSESAAEEDDMNVEIPLIETRDEVPLQDIWRMEDEERKDRLNGVKVTTTNAGETTGGSIEEHMKGEQHAHEEARLIQEAIDAHSQAL
ncbi:hypothetical protein BGZ47_010166 [Haplosporangium gracile]|nr:hypothetical protein BGZ47_010166 [Haplosporangium gracile]